MALNTDGHLIIYTDYKLDETKIWSSVDLLLVYNNNNLVASSQGLSQTDAARAVRGCGPKLVYMWPDWLETRVPGDVFLQNEGVYFATANDAHGENRCDTKLLAFHPSKRSHRWEYSSLLGTLATTVNKKILLCRLVK